MPANAAPILLVDDDQGLLLSIKATLLSAGLPEPVLVSDSRRVAELIGNSEFQVVLLDLIMPNIGGLELLKQIKEKAPEIECIVVTAVDQAETAVQALSSGAYDYLVKPLNSEKLLITINHALERYRLRQELSLLQKKQSFADLRHPEAFENIIAGDEAMALVFKQVEAVAPTDYSVVINGESGTGKEMLARVIHKLSNRATAPFVAINMAAVSETIFEDEFFGHAKGAYTDAVSDRKGFFEAANGGTLFLDEVTELNPSLQGKLLRVIEERELYRLGSTEVRNIDVRIIAATNRDIQKEIELNRFRADLYYRLNMYHINIPPLRDRADDILPLARFFTKHYSESNGKRIDSLSRDLAQRLLAYSFPGNVRELEHLIASAVLLEQNTTLSLSSVPQLETLCASSSNGNDGWLTLEDVEKRHLREVLKAVDGNKAKAAEILGINPSTVYRKIEKYHLDRENPKTFH